MPPLTCCAAVVDQSMLIYFPVSERRWLEENHAEQDMKHKCPPQNEAVSTCSEKGESSNRPSAWGSSGSMSSIVQFETTRVFQSRLGNRPTMAI